jgi:hypothetical protein
LEDFASFIKAVNQLNELLAPYRNESPPALPGVLRDQIGKLSTYASRFIHKAFLDTHKRRSELEDAKTKIEWVQNRTMARRIFEGSDDAQLIIDQLRIIRDAIDRIMVCANLGLRIVS